MADLRALVGELGRTGAAFVGTALLLITAAPGGGHWHVLALSGLGGVALVGFSLVLALVTRHG